MADSGGLGAGTAAALTPALAKDSRAAPARTGSAILVMMFFMSIPLSGEWMCELFSRFPVT